MKPNETPTGRPSRRTWIRKFQDAFRGLWVGLFPADQPLFLNSSVVHLIAAVVVLGYAVLEKFEAFWMAILIGCVAMVLVAELLNTSIERLARAITREDHPDIRDALDIASGAVLMASLFALVIGCVVLLAA